jgi:hypothetical protein
MPRRGRRKKERRFMIRVNARWILRAWRWFVGR